MTEAISIRVDRANPNHHLWNNNGTWFMHYTMHAGHTKQRIRRSLQTQDAVRARLLRDSLLTQTASGHAIRTTVSQAAASA